MYLRVTCPLRTSIKMGYYGIGIVRLRTLRQAFITRLIGKTIYRATDHKNLVYLANSTVPKTGEIENYPVGIQVSDRTYPGNF